MTKAALSKAQLLIVIILLPGIAIACPGGPECEDYYNSQQQYDDSPYVNSDTYADPYPNTTSLLGPDPMTNGQIYAHCLGDDLTDEEAQDCDDWMEMEAS